MADPFMNPVMTQATAGEPELVSEHVDGRCSRTAGREPTMRAEGLVRARRACLCMSGQDTPGAISAFTAFMLDSTTCANWINT